MVEGVWLFVGNVRFVGVADGAGGGKNGRKDGYAAEKLWRFILFAYICSSIRMKIVRIILLVISILAALGLVATTLAGAVAPSQSLQPSVLAFGFLPMLGLNVLLVAVWLLMGRWEFLLPVAVIVARFSVVGLYFQVGGRSEVPSAEEHPPSIPPCGEST